MNYQEEDLKQLKQRVTDLEAEVVYSREFVRLTKEILKEYEEE